MITVRESGRALRVCLLTVIVCASAGAAAAQAPPAPASPPTEPTSASVAVAWNVPVPLRDGVKLSATLYTPKIQAAPAPCVLEMTPYVADSYHERGTYFAARGLPFAIINVRGRGDSGGVFTPFLQEPQDGYDAVEWLARQPACNGKVAMWGGSYAGFDQWATAKTQPPHLATIVPVAAAHAGVDFPARERISYAYLLQWLAYTAGHTSQANLFADSAFWNALWLERARRGAAFSTLGDALPGLDAHLKATLAEWVAHPDRDAYWDAQAPTAADYRAMTFPVLTITGAYDDDQPGALSYYREFMREASPEERARHFLVIGPWDHLGTRTPKIEVGGVRFGPASLLDVPALHVDWYRWTMAGGPRPAFLRKPVAYYVAGDDAWRYADTLEAVTVRTEPLFLDSTANADRVLSSGALRAAVPGRGAPDHYVYDPLDLSLAELETRLDPSSLVDQTWTYAHDGRQLVYHSAPMDRPTLVSGFFRLKAWIALDQPDTDIKVTVYEVTPAGEAVQLSSDQVRARYRGGERRSVPISTRAPLPYDLDGFTFISRRLAKGSRLRLVIAPLDSIGSQRNFNAAKPVSEQTAADARPVRVTLLHDAAHPSALYVPLGEP